MRRIISSRQGVSEVIGVVFLLAVTVMLFTMLNANVLSFSFFSGPPPSVNIIATIDKENSILYIEHNGGDSLDITTDVIITIGSSDFSKKAGDLLLDINHDLKWNLGENLKFSFKGLDITGKYIGLMVIDSNAVVLSVVLQKGIS